MNKKLLPSPFETLHSSHTPLSEQHPRYFLAPDFSLPLVHLQLAFRGGRQLEPAGHEGLSRILLRLMKRKTRFLESQAIDEKLDLLGSELGIEVNASSCIFHGSVLARNLDEFIELLVEIFSFPSLLEEEFHKLVRETESEILDSVDDDQQLVQDAFKRALFGNHPYGRSSVGTIHSLKRITIEDVRQHFDRMIRRENLVAALSGSIDDVRANKVMNTLLACLPEGATTPGFGEAPKQKTGRHLIFVDKPERSQTQIQIGRLGTLPYDDDHFALLVAVSAFGGTFTSRLMKEIRSKRGWSYGAYARLGIEQQRHEFSTWTFPSATDASDCVRLQLDMLEELLAKGITKKEASLTKRYICKSNVFDTDTAYKRACQKLDEQLLGLPQNYHETKLSKIAQVDDEKANCALKKRLDTRDLIVAVVGTRKDLLAKLQASISQLESTIIVTPKTISDLSL